MTCGDFFSKLRSYVRLMAKAVLVVVAALALLVVAEMLLLVAVEQAVRLMDVLTMFLRNSGT